MKKSKKISTKTLIAKNFIICLALAILASVIYVNIGNVIFYKQMEKLYGSLDYFTETESSIAAMPAAYLTENGMQLLVYDENYTLVSSKGAEYIQPKNLTQLEFAQMLSNSSANDVYASCQIISGENGKSEIAVVLQSVETATAVENSTGIKMMQIYFVLIIAGIVLIFICTVALFVRLVYRPLKQNFDTIEQQISKTPYDYSKADLELVSLKEGQNVLATYNKMIEELSLTKAQKEKAQQASKQLISNLAHDLKSPITVLKGYAEILSTQQLSLKETREYTSYIYKSASDLNDLVSLLMEQTRLGEHANVSDFKACDVNSLLRDICANYYMIFDRDGYEFIADIDENPCIMPADSVSLNRVFSNLLQNILNHSKCATKVRVSSCVKDGVYTIRIMDNGVGIKAENREKVFQPFFCEDQSRSSSGNGIGLYVTKEILLQHNASIIIEDNDEYTMSFRIDFKLN